MLTSSMVRRGLLLLGGLPLALVTASAFIRDGTPRVDSAQKVLAEVTQNQLEEQISQSRNDQRFAKSLVDFDLLSLRAPGAVAESVPETRWQSLRDSARTAGEAKVKIREAAALAGVANPDVANVRKLLEFNSRTPMPFQSLAGGSDAHAAMVALANEWQGDLDFSAALQNIEDGLSSPVKNVAQLKNWLATAERLKAQRDLARLAEARRRVEFWTYWNVAWRGETQTVSSVAIAKRIAELKARNDTGAPQPRLDEEREQIHWTGEAQIQLQAEMELVAKREMDEQRKKQRDLDFAKFKEMPQSDLTSFVDHATPFVKEGRRDEVLRIFDERWLRPQFPTEIPASSEKVQEAVYKPASGGKPELLRGIFAKRPGIKYWYFRRTDEAGVPLPQEEVRYDARDLSRPPGPAVDLACRKEYLEARKVLFDNLRSKERWNGFVERCKGWEQRLKDYQDFAEAPRCDVSLYAGVRKVAEQVLEHWSLIELLSADPEPAV